MPESGCRKPVGWDAWSKSSGEWRWPAVDTKKQWVARTSTRVVFSVELFPYLNLLTVDFPQSRGREISFKDSKMILLKLRRKDIFLQLNLERRGFNAPPKTQGCRRHLDLSISSVSYSFVKFLLSTTLIQALCRHAERQDRVPVFKQAHSLQ